MAPPEVTLTAPTHGAAPPMIEPAMPHTARDTRLAPAVTPTLRLLEVMNTADNRGTTAPTAKLRQLEVMNTETQRSHDICEVEDEPRGAQHKAPTTSEKVHQGVARALDRCHPAHCPWRGAAHATRLSRLLRGYGAPRRLCRLKATHFCGYDLHSGASSAVYFGRRAMQLTHEVGRLREDDLGVVYLDTPLGRCAVLETPTSRQTSSAFTCSRNSSCSWGCRWFSAPTYRYGSNK
ncbi:unnamed protein product [Sphagnum jensenii]|uniref:Uncharacterized protein n=1 Tax=Sphagnum jensenii TaxID=128206 RepID=A0ABP0VPD1_9BRYO